MCNRKCVAPIEVASGAGESVEQLEQKFYEQRDRVVELELEAEESVIPKGFSRVYTPT